ncbi:MAG: redoxin domain-containing protein [Leptospirales bacterium]|nr:redoxin domain-containing protein [Leptospirales bacterium]
MKLVFSLLVLICVAGCAPGKVEAQSPQNRPLPEFTHKAPGDWINSAPLTRKDLSGKVVLIDVWTFACWNCYRSFPWLQEVEKKFAGKAFTVVGVHTPELEIEKISANVEAKVKHFKLNHPIVIDTDFSYWNALDNQYWPAYYLVDKKGIIRYVFVGETHSGDTQALKIEASLAQLLNE